jgi:hypothetical protein
MAIFVKDIAESLLDTDHDVLVDVDESTGGTSRDRALSAWTSLVKHLRTSSNPTFALPTLMSNIDFSAIHVAKGTLSVESSCLPDPFLLALKGAINFSSHVHTKLFPACPSEIVDDENYQ